MAASVVNTYQIGVVGLAIDNDGGIVFDGAPLTLHRNGCRSGQNGENGVLHLRNSNLPVLVYDGEEICIEVA